MYGNFEYILGKNVVFFYNDWVDVLVGDLFYFYYYIIGNVGEGIIVKCCIYVVFVIYLIFFYVESGMC